MPEPIDGRRTDGEDRREPTAEDGMTVEGSHWRNRAGRGSTPDVYETRYDPAAGSPPIAVVDAVACATETDPTALPPLQRAIDGAALEALLGGADRPTGEWALSFAYAGTVVTVRSTNDIVVATSREKGF